jgi:branched-chain amino acid transport system permease protein
VLDADHRHRRRVVAGDLRRWSARRRTASPGARSITACRGGRCRFVGQPIGLVFGLVIAMPATRLDGFYYALLTLGINELCRVYVVQSRTFGSATGGLYGAPSYLPEACPRKWQLLLGFYACMVLMIAALFLYRFVNGTRLGRILRAAPEKKEAFAEATGIDFRSARIRVFLISSIALGVIGGFYAAHFRGASPTLFSFDLVLMMLAMIVIGGLGRAEGAVVGTLIVIFIEKYLIDWGPLRLILIGLIMLGVVLFLRGGLFGMKQQFRTWRNKKKSERRSTRAEKGGEMLPEEATETRDKNEIFARRFDKQQRDFLKTLVTDEVIEEHRREAARPAQRTARTPARLFPSRRAERQVRNHGHRAFQGIPGHRAVGLPRRGAAGGRRQDLHERGRGLPRCVPAPRAGPARVVINFIRRFRTWHRSRFSVTATSSRSRRVTPSA